MNRYWVGCIATLFLVACGSGDPHIKAESKAKESSIKSKNYAADIKSIAAEADLPTPANADAALELVYVMKIDKTMMSMMSVMQGELLKVALTANPELNADSMVIVQDYVAEDMKSIMPEILEEFAQLYRDTVSQKAIEDSLAFYKSESGQIMIEKQPELMSGGAKIGNGIAVRLLERLENHLENKKPSEAQSE